MALPPGNFTSTWYTSSGWLPVGILSKKSRCKRPPSTLRKVPTSAAKRLISRGCQFPRREGCSSVVKERENSANAFHGRPARKNRSMSSSSASTGRSQRTTNAWGSVTIGAGDQPPGPDSTPSITLRNSLSSPEKKVASAEAKRMGSAWSATGRSGSSHATTKAQCRHFFRHMPWSANSIERRSTSAIWHGPTPTSREVVTSDR